MAQVINNSEFLLGNEIRSTIVRVFFPSQFQRTAKYEEWSAVQETSTQTEIQNGPTNDL